MQTRSLLLLSAAIAALPGVAVALEEPAPDEIIVTASPLAKSINETIIGVSVISAEELQRNAENSIGETLRRVPGVSSTFFGPGASRPVIRGLGGDRISVLDAGIGSIDASATSPDHAVAIEPATAQRIEIVRGAGTLLYGSSAAGGVVNVFSGRIPRAVPEEGRSGALRIGRTTVDDGVEAAGGFDVKLGDVGPGAFVFHGEGYYRDGDDYEIPGFAESAQLRAAEEAEGEAPEEEAFGIVENTSFSKKGGSVGLSYVFDQGFIGLSASANDSNYGVPGGHAEEGEGGGAEEEEEEGGVRIDLRQRRLDLDSEFSGAFLIFSKAKLRLGYADYEHQEIEPSGEVGTIFTNEGWEGRLELVETPRGLLGGELGGAIGVQYRHRAFSAIGEEAFVPPTDSDQYGVFALKELTTGPLRFELGGRYENTIHDSPAIGERRTFDAFSVSGGIGYSPSERVFFGVTGFRTERAPSIEELFSDGPHLATQSFEIGDPTLGEETARGVEATLKIGGPRLAFSVNGYYTSYKDFIYEAETGAEEDGLPVFQFTAADATFRGFEVEVEAEIATVGAFDIHADASADFVRATVDVVGDEDLPRIPPLSGLVGFEARSEKADLRLEGEFAADQDRTADFEFPTDGYALFHAYLTLRPWSSADLAVRLSALNLTDEEARLHTSFLKELAPLPGRNFRISLNGSF